VHGQGATPAARKAAHLWERAAAKEKEGKRRAAYDAKAEAARERAGAAAMEPAPSAADLLAKVKGLRGGSGG
jgi:hypothetical protein